MPNIWFVIPAHGRERVSAAAFAGIAWTRDRLLERGIAASVVVVADDANLDLAAAVGFDTLESPNGIPAAVTHVRLGEAAPPHTNGVRLGGKFNDGFVHALARDADFVIPCGSDDWAHPDLIQRWLAAAVRVGRPEETIVVSRTLSVVGPGGELAELRLYTRGAGIRLISASLLRRHGGRPVPEQQSRSIDSSIDLALEASGPVTRVHADARPHELVDFKSDPSLQLNGYTICRDLFATRTHATAWPHLADVWPAELVDTIRDVYRPAVAA